MSSRFTVLGLLISALFFSSFAKASEGVSLEVPEISLENKRIAEKLLSLTQKKLYKNTPKKKDQAKLPGVSIVISQAMGEQDLLQVMRISDASKGKIGLVITGLNKDQKGIFEPLRVLMKLARSNKLSPMFYIEPFVAKEYDISVAPTLVYRQEGKVLVVSGRTDYKTFQKKLSEYDGKVMREGIQGSVVEISEINLMDIIAQRINEIDWVKKKDLAVSRYWKKMASQWSLPQVTKDSVRSIDLSVVVPENLKDQNGRVYLRKGQVVNPLEKMAFTNAVIVFNGAKPKEIAVAKLLKKQSKEKGLTPILITTGLPGEDKNALGKLYNEFGDWVYFLDKQFKERFSIKSTPSMVVPDKSGKVVVVEVAP